MDVVITSLMAKLFLCLGPGAQPAWYSARIGRQGSLRSGDTPD
jgi:hypothetical protein